MNKNECTSIKAKLYLKMLKENILPLVDYGYDQEQHQSGSSPPPHMPQSQSHPSQLPPAQTAFTVTSAPVSNIVVAQSGRGKAIVPDYTIWSVVSLLCCCLPLGIAALVASSTAQDEQRAGNMEAARSCSATALVLNILATIGGLCIFGAVSFAYLM